MRGSGRVRFVRQFTNDFTGLTWREYEGTDARGRVRVVGICVRPYFTRGKSNAECRREAVRELRAVR